MLWCAVVSAVQYYNMIVFVKVLLIINTEERELSIEEYFWSGFEDETWKSCRHLIESDQAYLAGTHHDVLHRIYVMLHYVQRL